MPLAKCPQAARCGGDRCVNSYVVGKPVTESVKCLVQGFVGGVSQPGLYGFSEYLFLFGL